MTDQRLIWMPDSPRYFPPSALPVIELELADIVAVVRGRGGWPRRRWYMPLFRIDLRNGQTYLFQAPLGGTVRKAIAKAAAARRQLVEERGVDANAANALVEPLLDEQIRRDDALRAVILWLPTTVSIYVILWIAVVMGTFGQPSSFIGGTLLVFVGFAGAAYWIRKAFYRPTPPDGDGADLRR